MAAPVTVVVHDREVQEILSSDEVLQAIVVELEPIAARARRTAPRSKSGSHGRPAGFLASQIRIRTGRDGGGVYGDVVSPARTPDGFPYGALHEAIRPFIRASV